MGKHWPGPEVDQTESLACTYAGEFTNDLLISIHFDTCFPLPGMTRSNTRIGFSRLWPSKTMKYCAVMYLENLLAQTIEPVPYLRSLLGCISVPVTLCQRIPLGNT